MEAVPRSVLIDDENYAVKMDSASYLCNDGFIYIFTKYKSNSKIFKFM